MAATIQTIHKPTRARALDTSGNNNHGQIYSGRALEFDGVSDYFTTPALAGTSTFVDGESWTFATWINFNDTGLTFFVGKSGETRPHLGVHAADTLMIRADDSDYYGWSTGTIHFGVWYRYVLVAESNTLKLYLNGIEYGDTITTSTARTSGTAGSGTFPGTAMSFTGWGCPYESASTRTHHHEGMMSDVQLWDTEWTQADATYDYLNPEQLALNRGGTSLAESNLKLWYPMQDGHRGQQSFILDGSNVGVGSDIAKDGGFDTDVANGASGTYWNCASGNWTIANGVATNTGGDTNQIRQASLLTVGVSYKIQFDIVTITGGSISLDTDGGLTPARSTAGTHTEYLTATNTFLDFTPTSDFVGTIDNVKIYPINAKNHATTVFYGDEQISATNDRTFAGASNWANAAGANAFAAYDETTSGQLTVTPDDVGDVQYAYLDGANWEDADGDAPAMVAGRTYRLSYDIHISAYTKGTLSVGLSTDATPAVMKAKNDYTATNGSGATATLDFVYVAADHEMITVYAAANTVLTVDFDNISLKEVGTATGWTDADQQLDIPQTALQSYNQLAWFNGKGGLGASSVSCTSGSAIAPLDPLTFSCWFSGSQTGQVGLIRHCNFNADGYGIYIVTNDNTEISVDTHHDSTVTTYTTTSGTKDLLNGDLNHIVVVIDKTGSSRRVYINGSLMEQSASSFSYDTDATSTIGIGQPRNTGNEFDGIINEVSIWGDSFTLAEVQELYNDGKALDATTHSAEANLKGYWRNNGLATWADRQDNITANNLTVNNGDQTILIPAGVDGSRDNQGFLMNRQKTTNSLNLAKESYAEVPINHTFGTDDFSYGFWFKLEDGMGRFLVGVLTMGGDTSIGLTIDAGDGKIRARPFGADTVYTAAAYDDGEWHYAHHNIDRSADAILYIDGATAVLTQDISGAGEVNNILSTNSWHIGAGGGIQNFLAGDIDDFIVYSDILTTTEITRNYNAGKRSHR